MSYYSSLRLVVHTFNSSIQPTFVVQTLLSLVFLSLSFPLKSEIEVPPGKKKEAKRVLEVFVRSHTIIIF